MKQAKKVVSKGGKFHNAVTFEQAENVQEAIAKWGDERVLDYVNRMLATDARNWAAGKEGGKIYSYEVGATVIRGGNADAEAFLAGLEEA